MPQQARRRLADPPEPTFEEVIAPLAPAEFLRILNDRTLTFLPSTGNLPLANIFDWDILRGMIADGALPVQAVRMTHKERKLPPPMFTAKGSMSLPMVDGLLARGSSLIAEPLGPYVPVLDSICRDMGRRLGEQVKAAAVLTTGTGGAMGVHFDPFDLIVLQIEGSKRWIIQGPPAINPVEGMSAQPAPETEPLFDNFVRPGDFLFVPAGYWHRCENGPGQSLHVGIGIRPPTAWHALETLLPKLLDEPLLRVPFSRLDEAGRLTHEQRVKDLLNSVIRNASLPALIEERKSSGAAGRTA